MTFETTSPTPASPSRNRSPRPHALRALLTSRACHHNVTSSSSLPPFQSHSPPYLTTPNRLNIIPHATSYLEVLLACFPFTLIHYPSPPYCLDTRPRASFTPTPRVSCIHLPPAPPRLPARHQASGQVVQAPARRAPANGVTKTGPQDRFLAHKTETCDTTDSQPAGALVINSCQAASTQSTNAGAMAEQLPRCSNNYSTIVTPLPLNSNTQLLVTHLVQHRGQACAIHQVTLCQHHRHRHLQRNCNSQVLLAHPVAG